MRPADDVKVGFLSMCTEAQLLECLWLLVIAVSGQPLVLLSRGC